MQTHLRSSGRADHRLEPLRLTRIGIRLPKRSIERLMVSICGLAARRRRRGASSILSASTEIRLRSAN